MRPPWDRSLRHTLPERGTRGISGNRGTRGTIERDDRDRTSRIPEEPHTDKVKVTLHRVYRSTLVAVGEMLNFVEGTQGNEEKRKQPRYRDRVVAVAWILPGEKMTGRPARQASATTDMGPALLVSVSASVPCASAEYSPFLWYVSQCKTYLGKEEGT
jgi:hypothetical protein